MPEMRLFVAIPIREEIKQKLVNLQNELKSELAGVRWASPMTFHLTLKFIGEVELNLVKPICERVEKVAKKLEPQTLIIKSLGRFGSKNRTRVLWTDVEGDIYPIAQIVKELNAELEYFGIVPEKKAYRPHITLGRVKKNIDEQLLNELIEKYANREIGYIDVDSVVVFQSELKPEGAQHHPIKTIELD